MSVTLCECIVWPKVGGTASMHRSMSANAAAVTHQSKTHQPLAWAQGPCRCCCACTCVCACWWWNSKITPCPPMRYPGGQVPLLIFDQDLARVELTKMSSLPPISDVSRSPTDRSIPRSAMHSTTKTWLLSPGFLQSSASLLGITDHVETSVNSWEHLAYGSGEGRMGASQNKPLSW